MPRQNSIASNDYLIGDCTSVLKGFPPNSFDLIVTSPPYADSRKNTYGGISPDNYVDWFLPKSKEFLRVLKPTGTFILNIKEKVSNGERHTYVLDLIRSLRKQGWLWTEEYIWYKRNTHPGKWPNRFRDSWERCLQFNKSKKFNMYQEAVMVPIGSWANHRLNNLGKNDILRYNSQVGSGFGKNVSNWVGRDKVYPSNVIHLATECSNQKHSAAFPVGLPDWFVRLFTKEGDLVLDPFAGSGSTAVACVRNNRKYCMIDIIEEYKKIAEKRVVNEKSRYAESGRVCRKEHTKVPRGSSSKA
ncbi:MAG: site-specific DNA-methyltransferase [Candidatus Micrarchaeota archaeon]